MTALAPTSRVWNLERADFAAAVHWTLRIGAAACFIGHGVFGLIGKEGWLPYFAFFGIGPELAWQLMPVIGVIDITLGVITILRPMPAILLHFAFWGLMTALLRPLTGEPLWEAWERSGNWVVPLALLLLLGPVRRPLRWWFSALTVPRLDRVTADRVARPLRIGTALLLIGHGAFGALMHKASWFDYFATIGVGEATVGSRHLLAVVGWFEITLGIAVLAAPTVGVLVVVIAWKLGTELLRPLSGEPIWEFIERGGSYAAPMALLLVTWWRRLHHELDVASPARLEASDELARSAA